MTKGEIIEECQNTLPSFRELLGSDNYEVRGVLASEALLIIAIAKHFNVRLILESGRARGYSTQLFAKYFAPTPEVKVISIDYEQNEDTKYSEELLAQYPSVQTLYGDSNLLLPEHITEDCIIFIDGPKDEAAIDLTCRLLENPKVKAVLVHDLFKDKFIRDICERIFSNHFFSDDKAFVELTKNLDDHCWKNMEGTGFAPYTILSKSISSYGPTVGVFFNSEKPFNEPSYQNYIEFKEEVRPTLKKYILHTLNHDSLLFKVVRGVYRLIK